MITITYIYKYAKRSIVSVLCCAAILGGSLWGGLVDMETHDDGSISITGIYGVHHVSDPLLCELVHTPEFVRLQDVHQYGPWSFVAGPTGYTRWEHSLGVFVLTRMYGGSYQEQVAALLHDVSHTVFSHAGGWMYHTNFRKADAHQDDIHEWFLEQSSIRPILEKYGVTIYDVHHKREDFPVLEQPLPDICTDRLDYNLQGAYYERMIDQGDVDMILSHLHMQNGQWFFDDIRAASLFAINSVFMSRNIWGGSVNGILNYLLGCMLRHACDQNIITIYDIHFGCDTQVWNTLCASKDPYVATCLDLLRRYQSVFFYDDEEYTVWICAKFRGIDPYVLYDGVRQPLSACDASFARVFYATKNEFVRGWPLRCVHKEKEVV